VSLLCLHALRRGLLRRDADTLGRRILSVPLKRVPAREEEIPTVVAGGDSQRMRLHVITVVLVILLRPELSVGTEPALDFLDHPHAKSVSVATRSALWSVLKI
jgi:hypothetical protein